MHFHRMQYRRCESVTRMNGSDHVMSCVAMRTDSGLCCEMRERELAKENDVHITDLISK